MCFSWAERTPKKIARGRRPCRASLPLLVLAVGRARLWPTFPPNQDVAASPAARRRPVHRRGDDARRPGAATGARSRTGAGHLEARGACGPRAPREREGDAGGATGASPKASASWPHLSAPGGRRNRSAARFVRRSVGPADAGPERASARPWRASGATGHAAARDTPAPFTSAASGDGGARRWGRGPMREGKPGQKTAAPCRFFAPTACELPGRKAEPRPDAAAAGRPPARPPCRASTEERKARRSHTRAGLGARGREGALSAGDGAVRLVRRPAATRARSPTRSASAGDAAHQARGPEGGGWIRGDWRVRLAARRRCGRLIGSRGRACPAPRWPSCGRRARRL